MSARDFDEFVERKVAQAETRSSIDWKQRRDEWLQDVEALYASVEQYLADYIEDGRIVATREPLTLNEEQLGSYTVNKLTLKIGMDEVELVPVGAVIFGAFGRVDIIGPSGRIRLVLMERQAKAARLKITIVDDNAPRKTYETPPRETWSWKIAGSPPEMTLTDFNAETLREAILEVANA